MAEKSFSFKQTLENVDKLQTLEVAKISKTIEEQIDSFLKLIILSIKIHKINDIDKMQFFICCEQQRPPFRFGVYATYTLEKEEDSHYKITALSNMSYQQALIFITGIKDKLIKEGFEVVEKSKGNIYIHIKG